MFPLFVSISAYKPSLSLLCSSLHDPSINVVIRNRKNVFHFKKSICYSVIVLVSSAKSFNVTVQIKGWL